ncbi:MAG: T9SS type A sorting domain-containing protein [Limnohabitans sp.]|nr:T9SS type A sorting domain-containing protein [Limnohabitans sp.]
MIKKNILYTWLILLSIVEFNYGQKIDSKNIILTSKTYSKPIIESSTWIRNSGQTTILNSATVKLVADATNGYVELKALNDTDFFIAKPTSDGVFIAQTLDGSGNVNPNKFEMDSDFNTSKVTKLTIFPNPVSESFTVVSPYQIDNSSLELYDLVGKTYSISTTNIDSFSKQVVLQQKLASGVYTLLIRNETINESVKILVK